MRSFDFDHMVELAQRDPAAYFRARTRLIDGFIDGHPPGQAARLRELQWRIDNLRAVTASPIQILEQLGVMIGDHVEALQMCALRLGQASDGFDRALFQARRWR